MNKPSKGMSSMDVDLAEEITQTFLRLVNTIGRSKARTFGPGVPLTLVEAELCYYISTHEGVLASELAEQFGVSRSAVSQVITRLRAKGFVTEHSVAGDGKKKELRVSAAGRKAAGVAAQYLQLLTHHLYQESDEELRAYLRFLTKLEAFHDNIDALAPRE